MGELNEILRQINFEELIQLLKVYETKLPNSLRGFNYLKLQIDWLKNRTIFESKKLKTKFFTHRNGELTNGTFISISEEDDYSIFMSSLVDNLEEIKEIIWKTKIIKWKIGPYFYSVPSTNISILTEYSIQNNLRIEFQTPNEIFYLPKGEADKFEYEIPENIGMRELQISDATFIDDSWLYKNSNSLMTVKDLIKINGGLGIYSKMTGELLAWVIKNESFAIGRLQTSDKAKRKGYGKLLIKAFCREIAQRDQIDMIAYINITNTASRNLFVSLGFKGIGKCDYLKFKNEYVN